MKLLNSYTAKDAKKILKDPAVAIYQLAYEKLLPESSRKQYNEVKKEINRLYRLYVKGMMEMDANNVSFPDANLTLRVAYGHVKGFRPKDGVYYKPYTTLEGIMEKENPDKKFYPLEPRPTCRDMKKITLEDIRNVLRDLSNEVILSDEMIARAKCPIERMLAL